VRRRGRDGEGVGGLGVRNYVEATEAGADTTLVQQVCWRGRLAVVGAAPWCQGRWRRHLGINGICDLDCAMESNVQMLVVLFYSSSC
jgi:hypothetical protein